MPVELHQQLLMELITGIVQTYGDIAATAAAQWYEQARLDDIGETYDALTFGSFNPDKAFGAPNVVKQFAQYNPDNMAQTMQFLQGAIQRWVTYYGRETIARNCQHDPKKPRWARVPSGAKTCAFCEMLASRGFVYYSKQTAGALKSWHSHCDCMIVPEWDAVKSHITGYDPDSYYKRYLAARDAAERDDDLSTNNIVCHMRKLYPNQYTDSTSTKKSISLRLPPDVLEPTEQEWEHIIVNHRWDSTVPNKTRFADDWDDDRIKTAVLETIIAPDIVVEAGSNRKQLYKIVDEEVIRVWLQKTKRTHGKYKLHTAHRVLGQEKERRWAQIVLQRKSTRGEKL